MQTPQDALGLSFVGCRRVSTHAARDNQPEWIAAGSAALSQIERAARLFVVPSGDLPRHLFFPKRDRLLASRFRRRGFEAT